MRTTTASTRVVTGMVALVLAGSALVACTSGVDGEGQAAPEGERLAGSFEELLEQYLEGEENPYVIDVLTRAIDTGGITQAQYDEAHRMYTECMVNAGYEEEHKRLASGIIQITPPEMSAEEAQKYIDTAGECADELAPIEALYRAQQGNPDLLSNGEEIVVACFKRNQVVEATYTTTDLAEDLENRFEEAEYDPNDTTVQECFSAGGYAVAFEEEEQ